MNEEVKKIFLAAIAEDSLFDNMDLCHIKSLLMWSESQAIIKELKASLDKKDEYIKSMTK